SGRDLWRGRPEYDTQRVDLPGVFQQVPRGGGVRLYTASAGAGNHALSGRRRMRVAGAPLDGLGRDRALAASAGSGGLRDHLLSVVGRLPLFGGMPLDRTRGFAQATTSYLQRIISSKKPAGSSRLGVAGCDGVARMKFCGGFDVLLHHGSVI